MNKLRLIIPIYNDWTALAMLLRELDNTASTLPFQIFVSVINDGSTEHPQAGWLNASSFEHLVGFEIVTLSVNVGHQRAYGIVFLAAMLLWKRAFDRGTSPLGLAVLILATLEFSFILDTFLRFEHGTLLSAISLVAPITGCVLIFHTLKDMRSVESVHPHAAEPPCQLGAQS